MVEKYAEVILPLPVRGTFTYLVPDDLTGQVNHGSRVFVQFGSRKFYTGIVESLHNIAPDEFEPKPIIMLLDGNSCVRYPQIKFWYWISDYYLCTIGEVFKAAVPSGLKIESESYISLREDFDGEIDMLSLSERESMILQNLETKGRQRFSDLSTPTSHKLVYSAVNSLANMGVVAIDEQTVSRYRPKLINYVRAAIPMQEENLDIAFQKVKKSVKQERLLIAFLDLTGGLSSPDKTPEIEKKKLLESTGLSPAVLKALIDKGILESYKKEINRFKDSPSTTTVSLPTLTEIQSDVLKSLKEEMDRHPVTLLHGVTGSGKTEIYSYLISDALERRDQVLYLVPEISLTTQLTTRLRKVFGDKLLIYHSRFSDNERVDIWKKLLVSHEPLVILGVRSSVFLPFHHLGLVIVDEEHESSYKQHDPAPRYNARDAAIVLASMHGAKTLLGSATPSIETYYKAEHGKYGFIELTERYGGAELPEISVVDMRRQRKKKENKGILSSVLYEKTKTALSDGYQAIMFQNRRGFSPVTICKECGWVPKCRNCDVSLVYHKSMEMLRCHYCGFSMPLPAICPVCGQNGIEVYGYGTERIEEDLTKEFPEYKVTRMDLDTTRNKDAYQDIIDQFSQKATDILTGTQMVSKGLDFANVKVVGVMNADTMLHFPDFRAQERAFNMLVQVAGRAGRRNKKGEVIIQTTDPGNETLSFVRQHDYTGFYGHEIKERMKFNFPPFRKIINIYFKHKDSRILDEIAVKYALALKATFGDRVLGPERPTVGRISNYYHQCIMLKIESGASMRKVKIILQKVYEKMSYDRRMKGVTVYYDVDPV